MEWRLYKEKRAAFISECVTMRLDSHIMGSMVLPQTWAGISKANDDCRALVELAIQLHEK